jgi:hypothetical protein
MSDDCKWTAPNAADVLGARQQPRLRTCKHSTDHHPTPAQDLMDFKRRLGVSPEFLYFTSACGATQC